MNAQAFRRGGGDRHWCVRWEENGKKLVRDCGPGDEGRREAAILAEHLSTVELAGVQPDVVVKGALEE